jgi:deoxyribodipyrimidine photo-lyase
MYYHLLDGDWASNALSWQWVAGTFSTKKYIANQENINRYTGSTQTGTILDISYEELELLDVPNELKSVEDVQLTTQLPKNTSILIDQSLPTAVYTYYNLSPTWRSDIKANRILLLEPEIFKRYPVSEKCISFALDLAKNINGIQVFTGSFTELKKLLPDHPVYFREHPLNNHYSGVEDPRPWLIPDAKEFHGSFFSFWKKNEKKIRDRFLKNRS